MKSAAGIPEAEFLEALQRGVRRTTDLIARVTEYHGGPVQTEYMITADLAREFMERDFEVKVECLNRNLVNGMTALKGVTPRKELGAMRTDVAIVQDNLIPLALIEVKIGVKKLGRLKDDLDKITATIALMKARFAAQVIGAAVFQVHIPGTCARYSDHQFKTAAEEVETGLEAKVGSYASSRPDFSFSMHSLQSPMMASLVTTFISMAKSGSWISKGMRAAIMRS